MAVPDLWESSPTTLRALVRFEYIEASTTAAALKKLPGAV